MTAQSSRSATVGQLLDEAEKLRPSEFEHFVVRVMALSVKRKSNGLSSTESSLLKKINKEFSAEKMERFLILDEQRRQEQLNSVEHQELLSLVQQLEKYDAQKLKWIGQLALLRNVPFDTVLSAMGMNKIHHG